MGYRLWSQSHRRRMLASPTADCLVPEARSPRLRNRDLAWELFVVLHERLLIREVGLGRRHTAAVTALLDRLLDHALVINCGLRGWRTGVQTDLCAEAPTR